MESTDNKGRTEIMTHGDLWRAEIGYARPDTITDDQYDTLVHALTGYGIAVAGETYLTLHLTVAGPTLRQATDVALRTARTAYTAAFNTPGEQLHARVVTEAAHIAEIRRPPRLDLVGTADIAAILGVSRQRVNELAEDHPLFPNEVAAVGGRRVYTRDSITAFSEQWDRSPGRPASSS
jgi:hypothetical protein